MLPAAHRLYRAGDFAAAVRGGRRSGSRHVVGHLYRGDATSLPPRVGLVVSKAVGGAVVRNRVKRRLRGLMADRLGLLPDGCVLVLRANPSSSAATSVELGRSLDRTLDKLLVQQEGSR